MTRSTRTVVRAAVAALALGLSAGAVHAQSAQAKPPIPKEQPKGAAFSASAAGVLLAAMVLGAAGLKSKRGHQD